MYSVSVSTHLISTINVWVTHIKHTYTYQHTHRTFTHHMHTHHCTQRQIVTKKKYVEQRESDSAAEGHLSGQNCLNTCHNVWYSYWVECWVRPDMTASQSQDGCINASTGRLKPPVASVMGSQKEVESFCRLLLLYLMEAPTVWKTANRVESSNVRFFDS